MQLITCALVSHPQFDIENSSRSNAVILQAVTGFFDAERMDILTAVTEGGILDYHCFHVPDNTLSNFSVIYPRTLGLSSGNPYVEPGKLRFRYAGEDGNSYYVDFTADDKGAREAFYYIYDFHYKEGKYPPLDISKSELENEGIDEVFHNILISLE